MAANFPDLSVGQTINSPSDILFFSFLSPLIEKQRDLNFVYALNHTFPWHTSGIFQDMYLELLSSSWDSYLTLLLKPPLNKNRVFGTFLWSKWPEKICLFPNIYDNASHTLSEAQNGLKKGFYSILLPMIINSFGRILSGMYQFFKFLMSFCSSS